MDIAGLISQFATPAVLAQLARLLGTSEAAAAKGLGAAVPGVLAGLLAAAKRPGTVEALGAALDPAPGGASGLADLLGRDPAAAASTGSGLLAKVLGDGGDTLAGALGSYAGLPPAGARSLLGLAGSMALAALGKEAGDKGLDAAGVLNLLEGQKDQIARALPADFATALGGTGLMSALGGGVAAVRPAAAGTATAGVPTPPPPARRSGWTRWLIGLVVLLVLVWLVMRFLAPRPEPVVESPTAPAPAADTAAAPAAPAPATVAPAPAAPAAPAPEPAAPAATAPEPAATPTAPAAAPAALPADPLVVGGVDVGAGVRGALGSITAALAGVTDAASAEAALPQLTAARDTLSGLEGPAASLQDAGHAALHEMVAAALPAIQSSADDLLDDSAVAGVVKPVINDILARLTALGA